MEEKKEKSSKKITLCDEPSFYETFSNRQKLIDFLVKEYGYFKNHVRIDINQKVFTKVLDIKTIVNMLKNDTALMNKIKKPELKNLFYYLPKTRFEMFEQRSDNDHDLEEKYKKLYLENSEEFFVDELIFCKIDTICKILLIFRFP